MPIIPPGLDDRHFDDLVEELLARIPAHTPEWTNPRQGDPGRTLIELFAWLADTLLYRANLIPERQRLVFLKLLGHQLRPARPARGVVGLSYAQEQTLAATHLVPGGRVAGAVPFETLAESTVLPIGAEAYHKRSLTDAESARMAEVLQGLSRIHRLAGAPRGYETAPLFDGGRAVPEGIDVFAASADHALWLALLAPQAPDAATQPAFNDAARNAMGGGDTGAPALLSVGLVPALSVPELFEDIGPRARVPVMWEITTRGARPNETGYLTLEPVPDSDTTAGLTRAGVLRLPLPDESLIWAPSNDVLENPRAGVGDAPPRLDDLGKAARLIAWLRLRPVPGQPDVRLKLSWLGINAVQIEQRVTLGGMVLGASTGAPDEVFALPMGSAHGQRPWAEPMGSAQPETLRIQVEEPGRGYQDWQRVDDLAAISPNPQEARSAAASSAAGVASVTHFCGSGAKLVWRRLTLAVRSAPRTRLPSLGLSRPSMSPLIVSISATWTALASSSAGISIDSTSFCLREMRALARCRRSRSVGALMKRTSGPKVLSSSFGPNVPACSGPETNSQNGSKSWNCALFGS